MPPVFEIPVGNGPFAVVDLSIDAVRQLLEPQPLPCLSHYLPTHRKVPDNRVDRPSFLHLVEAFEMALAIDRDRQEIERLLRPFHRLASDRFFWEHTHEGLAVFGAAGQARIFLLPRSVKPLALVTSRFHTLPLIRMVAAMDRFNVLTLTSREAHVYQGRFVPGAVDPLEPVSLSPFPLRGVSQGEPLARSTVIDEEVLQPHRMRRLMNASGAVHGGFGGKQDDIDTDTEIFFRHVDEVVHERVSARNGLPLVLVALPQLAAIFRGLSKNPLLLPDDVARDVHLLPDEHLGRRVLPIFMRSRERRLARELHRFAVARDRHLAGTDLAEVAQAAVAGRVAALLVEEERFEPGRFDTASGTIHPDGPQPADLSRSGGRPAPRTEDLLGSIAETVLMHGGEILSLERIRMPTESGVAAIYRY